MFSKCYLNEWTGLHLFDHSFCLIIWPRNSGTLLLTGIPCCYWNLVLLSVQKVLVWQWLRSLFRLQWVLKGDQVHSSILSSAKSISFLGFRWLKFLFYSLFFSRHTQPPQRRLAGPRSTEFQNVLWTPLPTWTSNQLTEKSLFESRQSLVTFLVKERTRGEKERKKKIYKKKRKSTNWIFLRLFLWTKWFTDLVI